MPTADQVFRDYVVDGVPGSGLWTPQKTDIRGLFAAMGAWTNAAVNITSASSPYTVITGDAGKTIIITGTGQGTITFGAPAGYGIAHINFIANKSTRRWLIVMSGQITQWLWPSQTIIIFNCNNVWSYSTLPWWDGVGGPQGAHANAITFYVDPVNGLDTNDGLATGAGGALLKIQEAVNRRQFRMSGAVTIECAPGINTPPVGSNVVIFVTGAVLGSDLILIQGSLSGNDATNYVLQAPVGGTCMSVQDNGILVINGFYCTAVGNGAATFVHCRQQAVLDLNGCDMGATAGGSHISCTTSGSIGLGTGNNPAAPAMNVRGAAAVHVGCSNNSYVNYGAYTVNIPSALSMGFWFLASNAGVISNGAAPITYTGAGYAGTTGVRAIASTNGVIESSGVTHPGNSAPQTFTGGQYS